MIFRKGSATRISVGMCLLVGNASPIRFLSSIWTVPFFVGVMENKSETGGGLYVKISVLKDGCLDKHLGELIKLINVLSNGI